MVLVDRLLVTSSCDFVVEFFKTLSLGKNWTERVHRGSLLFLILITMCECTIVLKFLKISKKIKVMKLLGSPRATVLLEIGSIHRLALGTDSKKYSNERN